MRSYFDNGHHGRLRRGVSNDYASIVHNCMLRLGTDVPFVPTALSSMQDSNSQKASV